MSRRLERIAISGLRLPGDIAERMTRPHVLELAESIKAEGQLVPIIVELGTMRLVAGRDRVAAHRVLGVDQIEAVLVQGDELHLESVEIVENLHRRADNKDALKATYLELKRKQRHARVDMVTALTPERKPGRPRDEALHEAARDLGISAKALREADRRARGQDDDDKTPALAPCIDTLQLPPSEELAAVVDVARLVQGALERAQKSIAGAQQALAPLGDGQTFHASRLDLLKQQIRSARFLLEQSKPVSVCPFCKLTALRETCGVCNGIGHANEAQMQHVPPDLLLVGKEAVVYVDGKPVKVTTLNKRTKAPKAVEPPPPSDEDYLEPEEAGHADDELVF